jgi:putative oxidoreductase
VQAGPRLLPAFPELLSEVARRSLANIGVQVFLNSKVRLIDADGVLVNDRRIYSRTVLWAAGVAASPAAKWLNAEADKAGRVRVQPDLSVPHLPDVYVIGDTALANCWQGPACTGTGTGCQAGWGFRRQGHSRKAPWRARLARLLLPTYGQPSDDRADP